MPPPQPSPFFLLLRKRKRERELSLALARSGNGWIPACAPAYARAGSMTEEKGAGRAGIGKWG